MPGIKLSFVIVSATASFFIVFLLALIIIILKYHVNSKTSRLSQNSRTITLPPCLPGSEKSYSENVAQYLLGYTDECPGDFTDDETSSTVGLTRLHHVQPSSESDYGYPYSTVISDPPKAPTSTGEPQIDADMYKIRSYTDLPSPEGKSGIWRARESIFFKHDQIRTQSLDEGKLSDGNRSPIKAFRDRTHTQPILRRNPTPDRKAKLLFDDTRKVTGKPPLSPKVDPFMSSPSKKTIISTPMVPQPRRYSETMVLDKSLKTSSSNLNLGLRSSPGSLESLHKKLGGLEVSVSYSAEEQLLKVCVLDVKNPDEERSLVDSYVKVAFYLFEKPYRNEMQLWSNSTRSLVKRTFTYLVKNVADLQRATLRFTIRRKNSIVKDKVLGKAILRLCGKDVLQPQSCILTLEHSVTELHGELLVSVCHQATAGILRVGIIRAMGLAKTMRKTMGAPFVIVELSSTSEVFFVKNTKQKSNKIHPLFDETFEIPISTDSKVTLDNFHLKITVFRYTFSGSNDIVGMILLGSGTTSPSEAEHWKEITHNPHKTVMKWHKLRIA